MRIITPPDFFQVFNGTHLLLDTSIFIDAFLHPSEFGSFFNSLKENGTTLTSLDVVKIEFLKGAISAAKYEEKENFFNQIIDACLPITTETMASLFKITQLYRQEGKSLSVTDLFLGALMQYRRGISLLTKSTTEFPASIFSLVSYFNIHYPKGLHAYGIYTLASR